MPINYHIKRASKSGLFVSNALKTKGKTRIGTDVLHVVLKSSPCDSGAQICTKSLFNDGLADVGDAVVKGLKVLAGLGQNN